MKSVYPLVLFGACLAAGSANADTKPDPVPCLEVAHTLHAPFSQQLARLCLDQAMAACRRADDPLACRADTIDAINSATDLALSALPRSLASDPLDAFYRRTHARLSEVWDCGDAGSHCAERAALERSIAVRELTSLAREGGAFGKEFDFWVPSVPTGQTE